GPSDPEGRDEGRVDADRQPQRPGAQASRREDGPEEREADELGEDGGVGEWREKRDELREARSGMHDARGPAPSNDVHGGVERGRDRDAHRRAEVAPQPAEEETPEERFLAGADRDGGGEPEDRLVQRLPDNEAQRRCEGAEEAAEPEADRDAGETDRPARRESTCPSAAAEAECCRIAEIERSPAEQPRGDERDLEHTVEDAREAEPR